MPNSVFMTRIGLMGMFGLLLFACGFKPSSESNTNAIADAWQDVAYLDYRRAAPRFEGIRKSVEPGTDAWREATLGLALCMHQRQPDTAGDKKKAATLYDELIRSSQGNSIQATALLLRGKLAQLVDFFGDEPDFDKAVECYRQVISDWPDSACANEAALYLAQASVFTMEKDAALKAVAQLEEWIAAHPDNPYAATQWLLVSLAYRMPLEDQAAAVETSIKAVQAGLPNQMPPDALYWRIATMAENVGRKSIAREYYTRIIQEVQRSRYTYAAQRQIESMGFDPPELIDPFESK